MRLEVESIVTVALISSGVVGLALTAFEHRKRFWMRGQGVILESELSESYIPTGTGDPIANARVGVYEEHFDVEVRCRYSVRGIEVTSRPFRPVIGTRCKRQEAEQLRATTLSVGSKLDLFIHPRRHELCRCTVLRIGWGPLIVVGSLLALAIVSFLW